MWKTTRRQVLYSPFLDKRNLYNPLHFIIFIFLSLPPPYRSLPNSSSFFLFSSSLLLTIADFPFSFLHLIPLFHLHFPVLLPFCSIFLFLPSSPVLYSFALCFPSIFSFCSSFHPSHYSSLPSPLSIFFSHFTLFYFLLFSLTLSFFYYLYHFQLFYSSLFALYSFLSPLPPRLSSRFLFLTFLLYSLSSLSSFPIPFSTSFIPSSSFPRSPHHLSPSSHFPLCWFYYLFSISLPLLFFIFLDIFSFFTYYWLFSFNFYLIFNPSASFLLHLCLPFHFHLLFFNLFPF